MYMCSMRNLVVCKVKWTNNVKHMTPRVIWQMLLSKLTYNKCINHEYKLRTTWIKKVTFLQESTRWNWWIQLRADIGARFEDNTVFLINESPELEQRKLPPPCSPSLLISCVCPPSVCLVIIVSSPAGGLFLCDVINCYVFWPDSLHCRSVPLLVCRVLVFFRPPPTSKPRDSRLCRAVCRI